MSETAKIQLGGSEYELPVITGTENEKAIDIAALRGQSGYITIDPGFKNTGSTESAITFLDGEKGILRYRGYSIEELAENSNFIEVSYLLIYGKLPNRRELDSFKNAFTCSREHENDAFCFPSKRTSNGSFIFIDGVIKYFLPRISEPTSCA